jgi:hypothetical protein
VTFSWSCTPAPTVPTGPPTNSQNLRSLQLSVSKTEAALSGDAITGAVTGAISDAFSTGGGAPITVGPNGIILKFAADPQQRDAAALEAVNALAYAGKVYRAPPRTSLASEWSLWADVRGTGFDRDDTNASATATTTPIVDLHGRQLNVTGGLGRRLTPDFLFGILGGYETFGYTENAIAGRMTGNGGTAGAYAAYHFTQVWRLDGMFGWSDIKYNGTAGAVGAATGSFTGSRWLGSGGFTGTYRFPGMILEPSLRVYGLTEHEGSWTDSLGTLQTARTFSIGRASAGGKMIFPWETTYYWAAAGDVRIAPFVGIYGDYRFSSDNALPVSVAYVGIKDGFSGRAVAGVMINARGGASVSLSGEAGGLGSSYNLWSANARIHWPF